MTRDEILNMPAGRAMDSIIESAIFNNMCVAYSGTVLYENWFYDKAGNGFQAPPKYYSTNISAAWEVVEKYKDKFESMYYEFGKWVVLWAFNSDDGAESIKAETVPLAICRAALLAVME